LSIKSPSHSSSLSVGPRTSLPQSQKTKNEAAERADHRQAGDKKYEQNASLRTLDDTKALY
jgi:hypothetical protein